MVTAIWGGEVLKPLLFFSVAGDETQFAGLNQGFDAAPGIDFAVDVLQMSLDGHRGDKEPCGDFLVAQAFR